jgi:hypothetical protein
MSMALSGFRRWCMSPVLLRMLVHLVAAAKILAAKAGTLTRPTYLVFGRLLIGLACLVCCVNVPASSALVEVDFSQNDMP